jgi:transposase InsO family protein
MEERLRFVARRLEGADDRALSRVRHLAQDRPQALRPLEGARSGGAGRPAAAAGAGGEPAADAGRGGDRRAPAREAALGRAQAPRAARAPARAGRAGAGTLDDPRGAGTSLSEPAAANDLWCTDFKGEFRLGNGRWCYPLTVTDQLARYLLLCEALEGTREAPVFTAFHRLFKERGLPAAMRSDNGVPFAGRGLYGLSPLAVWWLRLGIRLERIAPGKPQQNGRHERMHLTLKQETCRPAAENALQQQARFDAFQEEFNTERPHEALDMKTPAEVYAPSPRPYTGLPELEYPLHDQDIVVSSSGVIGLCGRPVFISSVLAGQRLGLREVEPDVWLVSFMHYDLGYVDLEARTLQTIDNPFGAPPPSPS